MGNRGQANYAAAKAALHGASKSLSLELASRGVTVNCVVAGPTHTEGIEDFDARTAKRVVTTGCGQGSVFGDNEAKTFQRCFMAFPNAR